MKRKTKKVKPEDVVRRAFYQQIGCSESLEENNNVRWMIFKVKTK